MLHCLAIKLDKRIVFYGFVFLCVCQDSCFCMLTGILCFQLLFYLFMFIFYFLFFTEVALTLCLILQKCLSTDTFPDLWTHSQKKQPANQIKLQAYFTFTYLWQNIRKIIFEQVYSFLNVNKLISKNQ